MTPQTENAPESVAAARGQRVRNPNREVKERTMKSKPIMPQATVTREGRFEVKPDPIECPVTWCDSDDLNHGRAGELDFHMGEKASGPMFVTSYLTQLHGEPIKLEIESEWTGTETPDALRDFAQEAAACAAWLAGQADKLEQLNAVNN